MTIERGLGGCGFRGYGRRARNGGAAFAWSLALTGFAGLNLLQSAFTNWCPMVWILQRPGYSHAPRTVTYSTMAVQGGQRDRLQTKAGPFPHRIHPGHEQDGNSRVTPGHQWIYVAGTRERPPRLQFPIGQCGRAGEHKVGGQVTQRRKHGHADPYGKAAQVMGLADAAVLRQGQAQPLG